MPDKITLADTIDSSVQTPDHKGTRNLIWRLAYYDKIVPEWWTTKRDKFFREYWPTESFLASAIYSIANRNAAFGWTLHGLDEDVEYAQQMLQFMNFGDGWQQSITKFSVDYVSQDNGSFLEVIRPAKVKFDDKILPGIKQRYENDFEQWYTIDNGKRVSLAGKDFDVFDSPLDLPIGLANLDAGQCQRTGNPEIPIIYTDRYGKQHKLRWWQVLMFNEMPSPIQSMNNVGYSALTRVFRASHIMQSMSVFKDEKVSGRFNRAVHITNADADAINDAIAQANEGADNKGLLRYSQPIVATLVKPDATVSVETINLAEVPDGFNEGDTYNWYIANLALALGVDYGFLAPLPGKGLGTAAQSETAQRQARGKSSRLFMDAISNALNFKGILPKSVRFEFIERDIEEELTNEQTKKARADTRKIMLENGEITPTIARQMAVDVGDLEEEYLELLGDEDVTPAITVEGDDDVTAQQEIDKATEEQVEEQIIAEETEQPITEAKHHHNISSEYKRKAYHKLFKLEYEQIKETQKSLFEKQSLFKRLKNATYQTFGKKQIEFASTGNDDLDAALEEYGNDLESLALLANTGKITQDEFEEQLAELVTLALTAFYSEMSGIDPDNFTDDDLENVSDFIAINLESVGKLGNDIYDERYQDTEDRDGTLMLLTRLGLWVGSAATVAFLGTINNKEELAKPTVKQLRFEWVLNPTKENCPSCIALNGQVHTTSEWSNFGVYPRSPELICQGFRCGCFRRQTKKKIQGNLDSVPLA